MRIVFAGTPTVAVPSLNALIEHDLTPELVITRPDAPVGRKRVLTPSAVGAAAATHRLPILKTKRIGPALLTEHPDLDFGEYDLGVVVAYGGIIREPVLSAPKHGWINLHFSALPHYRGAAPVQRAILAGDRLTAVTVFQLVQELDAGHIIASEPQPLFPDETADQALARLAKVGAVLLSSVVQQFANHSVSSTQQQGEPSYAAKFDREDGFLNWNEPATAILNRYRAVTSEPGAYSIVDGVELKIHQLGLNNATEQHPSPPLAPGELAIISQKLLIGTGTAPIELIRVQPAGKHAMIATDWWRGRGTRG